MKRNLLILAIILLIGFIVNSCGGDDEQPQPTQQSKDITLAAGKKVTVTYTALPGATPSWWNKLSSQLQSMAGDFPTGTYTLTVTPDGTAGFAAGAGGSKAATVSESWLSGASDTDMMVSIYNMLASWITMIQPTHDNGWKQLKRHSAKIENANLINISFIKVNSMSLYIPVQRQL